MPEVSILVVEDEAITLECIVTTLAKKYPNSAIYNAINGRTGLELFKTHIPNIVITDINMPGVSGEQMAEKIREIKPDTKFITITGNNRKISLETSVEKGFKIDHYIDKPIDFLDLFAAIEQCLGEIAQNGSRPVLSAREQ